MNAVQAHGCDQYALSNALQAGVIILDDQHNILLWNDWIARLSGIPPKKAEGKALAALFPTLTSGRLTDAIDHALKHNLPSVISPAFHTPIFPLFLNADDRIYQRRVQQMIHVMPIAGNAGMPCCLIQISDMSASVTRERVLRQQAAELRRINYIDPLTGIANRRKFDEVFTEELNRAQRTGASLGLVMLDIDHFRNYNDHYGHAQGDQCLTQIAKALHTSLRRAGDLVARYGGEEFGIILPGIKESTAASLAEDLRLRIAMLNIPHETSPVVPQVTVSIGVAVMTPEFGTDIHTLSSAADIALYEAKRSGRNKAILLSIEDGSYRACA